MSKLFLSALFVALLYPLCSSVLAGEFVVVDQDGAPVADAILELHAAPVKAVSDTPAIMDQMGRQFAPRVLAIRKGRYVDLPNSDNVRHHVYSFSPAKTFEIKLYKGVSGEPMFFDRAGIVTLGCNIHDKMIGYIYVADHQHVAKSDEQGRLSFSGLVRGRASLWHPDQLNPQLVAELDLPASADGAPAEIVLQMQRQ